MIEFPSSYKIRAEGDFGVDSLVFERLQKVQKYLSHAWINMGSEDDGQITDDLMWEKYHICRVLDTDNVYKYLLWSGTNSFWVERLEHTKMIDDMFEKRDTPLMHIRYTIHSFVDPLPDMNRFSATVLALKNLRCDIARCHKRKKIR